MKISKRVRGLAAIVGSGIVVASSACSVDSTAPTKALSSAPQERASGFTPSAASKALIGVADGVYVVTFNPANDQHFSLGPNRLDIPANAVCSLLGSGYGPEYWNQPCTPETKPVTLTVTVKDATTDRASVDFQPAMRFNPSTSVQLYFYVPRVSPTDARNWTIQYCGTSTNLLSSGKGSGSGTSGSSGSGKCINEALTDGDLSTYIDYANSVLFRRIKHFSMYQVVDSGYLITE